MDGFDVLKCDVLVCGGGGAGCRAAIAAAEQGVSVILTTKGPISRSGLTPMANFSIQAAFHPEDSRLQHFQDTVNAGRLLADENLVQALAQDAPDRILDLVRYGVKFELTADGALKQRRLAGQTYPRSCVLSRAGFGMTAGLGIEVRRHENIRVLEDWTVLRLLRREDGAAAGAIAAELREGRLWLIEAKSVVIATGGYEELWAVSDGSQDSTGDGILASYLLGAELVDIEMMMYYPSVVCYPEAAKGLLISYDRVIDKNILGGRFLNGKGEEFVQGWPVRDVFLRQVIGEISGGRATPHGGVYVDLTTSCNDREHLTRELENMTGPFTLLKSLGYDLRETRVEVAPAAHYGMGGVWINEHCQTSIPGLFAAGEVAGNVNGANRLSGNALCETQVFGCRAGVSAAGYSNQVKDSPAVDRSAVEGELRYWQGLTGNGASGGEQAQNKPAALRRRIREIMWDHCGLQRHEQGMQEGLALLEAIENEDLARLSVPGGAGRFSLPLRDALEVRNMCILGQLVIRAAMFRRETRGHHIRTDYPNTYPELVRHTVIHKTARGLEAKWAAVVRAAARDGLEGRGDAHVR